MQLSRILVLSLKVNGRGNDLHDFKIIGTNIFGLGVYQASIPIDIGMPSNYL